MGETLQKNGLAGGPAPFKIDYPYYGLFGSADITPILLEQELVFRCQLLNGEVLFLKKQAQERRWIDASSNCPTPLSNIIGSSIDDFLQGTA